MTISTLFFAAVLIGGVALIVNEIHRHRYAIVRVLKESRRVPPSRAERMAELIEAGATGAIVLVLVLIGTAL